jgi:hypothetical protein
MKRSKSTTRQRGIALMMTLGVLALLLIMALAFAYTTRTERLAAGVNTDLIRARLLAESGVERAIAFLREQYAANPAPGTQFYVPVLGPLTSEAAWVFNPAVSPPGRGGRYVASVNQLIHGGVESNIQAALASTIRVVNTSLQFTPESRLHDQVGWIPIRANNGSDTESPVVGLVSYLVVDETGKIDPSLAVGSISGTASEDTSNPDTRLGLDMREIALADVYAEQSGWPQPYSYGMAVGTVLAVDMPSPGRWHSMYHIMNAFGGHGIANQSWLDRLTWSLRPFSVEEPEAYAEGGALYHRRDLSDPAFDWNTIIDVASLPVSPLAVTAPYSTALAGIPWVAQIKSADAAVHDQVVADFIDFCDNNNTATTDFTIANFRLPSRTMGTYCGLEKVPYVNEVQVLLSYAHDTAALPNGVGSFQVALSIELVNMYADGLTNVDVEWEVVCQATAGPAGVTGPMTFSNVGSPVAFAVPANQYRVVDATTCPSASAELTKTISLTGVAMPADVTFSISSIKVVLTSGGNPADISQVRATGVSGTVVPGTALLTPNYLYFGRAVNDPRCNTRDAEWQTIATSADGTGITLGSANAFPVVAGVVTDAGTGAPLATYPDPATSTAVSKFIGNRPLISFWELGAIHRGEPWRTINLHSSDQLRANIGEYSYGDWPLLNQVRLTSATTSRGGINVWDIPTYVWKPLLQGLRLGTPFENPAGYLAVGTELTDNAALVLAAAAIASNPPVWLADDATYVRYQGRGAIVGYGRLSDGTLFGTQTTDALQEEVIGKVVGLLNDRISYYTIIVCAKAVQDVGGLPAGMTAAPGDWIQYETGHYCRPVAEQKVMALVWRDVTGNQFRIASFQYLDEE